MSKIFILVASLMCISTLVACSGRASTDSDPTSICPFQPFDDACTDTRFDVNKIEHCNSTGLSASSGLSRAPHADFDRCTELAEATPCLQNPFQEICEETPIFEDDIDNLRFGRISLCGFGGGSGAPCTFVNSCGDNGNPFDAECLKFDDFRGNRTTRIRLCTERQGNVVSGCTNLVGTQTIAQCIGTNPFHADCTHEAFDAARVARVAECSEASPNAALLCGNAIGGGIGSVDGTQTIANCITEPFHADCQNLAFNTSRAERMIACGGADDPSGVDCDVARTGATSANWLRSFDGTPENPRLDTEPNEDNPRNQFLQGTEFVLVILDDDGEPVNPTTGREGGLDIGDALRVSNETPEVYSLNLRDALYGDIPEEGRRIKPYLLTDAEGEQTGDASDGVAFFYGSIAGEPNGYAGILAGTNLGEVPDESTPSATWNGQFRVIGNYFADKDFKLDINFRDESVEAFVQVRDEDDPLHFLIKGDFDRNGVISGTVELGDYTGNDRTATPLDNDDRGSGQLTGLIGVEGAVGVFIKNPTDKADNFNFAGGFVAAPTPDPEPTP